MTLYLPSLEREHVSVGTQHSFPYDLQGLGVGQAAMAVWPSANLGIFIPLYVRAPFVAQQIDWVNGTVVSAPSMEVALYNEAGTVKLATSGVVTQVGSGVPQAVAISGGLLLGRGRYWMGMVLSNNTSGIMRFTGAAALTDLQKFIGNSETALGSTALPASITFASAAQSYIPMMGLSGLSLAI